MMIFLKTGLFNCFFFHNILLKCLLLFYCHSNSMTCFSLSLSMDDVMVIGCSYFSSFCQSFLLSMASLPLVMTSLSNCHSLAFTGFFFPVFLFFLMTSLSSSLFVNGSHLIDDDDLSLFALN